VSGRRQGKSAYKEGAYGLAGSLIGGAADVVGGMNDYAQAKQTGAYGYGAGYGAGYGYGG
jgi:hypothetical protein